MLYSSYQMNTHYIVIKVARIFDFFWRIYIRRIDIYEFSTSIGETN